MEQQIDVFLSLSNKKQSNKKLRTSDSKSVALYTTSLPSVVVSRATPPKPRVHTPGSTPWQFCHSCHGGKVMTVELAPQPVFGQPQFSIVHLLSFSPALRYNLHVVKYTNIKFHLNEFLCMFTCVNTI